MRRKRDGRGRGHFVELLRLPKSKSTLYEKLNQLTSVPFGPILFVQNEWVKKGVLKLQVADALYGFVKKLRE